MSNTVPDYITEVLDEIAPSKAKGDFIEFNDGGDERKRREGSRSLRDRERLRQGVGAVLTVRRAAELLPLNDADARRWLREKRLVRVVLGTEVVVWAEVLEALSSSSGSTGDSPPAPPARKRRKSKVLPRVEITPLATGTDR